MEVFLAETFNSGGSGRIEERKTGNGFLKSSALREKGSLTGAFLQQSHREMRKCKGFGHGVIECLAREAGGCSASSSPEQVFRSAFLTRGFCKEVFTAKENAEEVLGKRVVRRTSRTAARASPTVPELPQRRTVRP